MPALRIEASELAGQRFACLEGCGFCCLSQPGLTPAEAARFAGPLRRAVAPGGDALRVVGQAGPCGLLDAARACTQYALRPRGCRSFPYHTTMAWRVQVSLNRGCPGTRAPGAPPALRGFDPGQALPHGPEAAQAAAAGRASWEAFRARARAAGVYEAPGRVQRRLAACAPLMADEPGLAAALALAEAGGPVHARALRAGRGRADPAALHAFLEEQARATFTQPDPKRLPTHVGPAPSYPWLAYRLRGDRVQRLAIQPGGSLAPRGEASLFPLLPPRDAAAQQAYAAHAGVVARRDLVVALAAFMLDRLGYGEPLASATLRELVAALGDLWMRAGLLARFGGRGAIAAPDMEAGVAFFDLDFLNAPTLGVAL